MLFVGNSFSKNNNNPEKDHIYSIVLQIILDIHTNTKLNDEDKIFYIHTLNEKFDWKFPNPKILLIEN